MTSARDLRRGALQALYQFDAGNDSEELVRQSLDQSAGSEKTHDEAFRLARAAWEMRGQADAAVAARTPDWPTHRQPAVDRSILRLAYFEIVTGHAPPKVVINEAVELAKEFSTDKSALFLNGVLDKIYRALREEDEACGNSDPPNDDSAAAMRAAAPPEGPPRDSMT